MIKKNFGLDKKDIFVMFNVEGDNVSFKMYNIKELKRIAERMKGGIWFYEKYPQNLGYYVASKNITCYVTLNGDDTQEFEEYLGVGQDEND